MKNVKKRKKRALNKKRKKTFFLHLWRRVIRGWSGCEKAGSGGDTTRVDRAGMVLYFLNQFNTNLVAREPDSKW